jgi:hypothetical protein
MATRHPLNLTVIIFIALLPISAALAGGRGGVAGPQGAVGSSLSGASGYGQSIGGGPAAGAVGGGPPAGLVGGGVAPTNTNPTSSSGLASPAVGGATGSYTGVPQAPDTPAGGLPPGNTANGKGQNPGAPKSVEGVAEEPSPSPTGLAQPSQDGASTRTVAPHPCGIAAHETDGTTTCIGIPSSNDQFGPAHRHGRRIHQATLQDRVPGVRPGNPIRRQE